jgi:hypothetical protein
VTEFWARADLNEAAFRSEELRMFGLGPDGRLATLGLFRRGEDLYEVECDACGDRHIEHVQVLIEPPGSKPRMYIGCKEVGRVRVEPGRLEVWRIDFDNVARLAAEALGLGDAPRNLLEGRIWLLGSRTFGDRARDTFLVRGSCWEDGHQLISENVRLTTSPCPVILVPNQLPDASAWRTNGRVLLSMSEFDWFGDQRADVLRKMTGMLVEFGRRATPSGDHLFLKEGQYWTIRFAGKTIRMKDSKGLLYLFYVLSGPGREFPAVELLTAAEGRQITAVRSSAGDVLDQPAMNHYKARAAEISTDIEEARGNNDLGRIEKLQSELALLADQIASAKGFGGRHRSVGDTNERARKAVGQAVTRAIAQIRKTHPALAQHLEKQLTLGTSLFYSSVGTLWNS